MKFCYFMFEFYTSAFLFSFECSLSPRYTSFYYFQHETIPRLDETIFKLLIFELHLINDYAMILSEICSIIIFIERELVKSYIHISIDWFSCDLKIKI